MTPTKTAGTLDISTPSDREIRMTRVFNAPRKLVFDAYTKPELLTRWMGVMPGWTWAVCEIDLRVGGTFRYLWRGPDGFEMGMRGTYLEITPPHRIVSTESFDQKWYEGECVETVTLEENDGRTTLTMLLRYDNQAVRDGVLRSGATTDMEAASPTLPRFSPHSKDDRHAEDQPVPVVQRQRRRGDELLHVRVQARKGHSLRGQTIPSTILRSHLTPKLSRSRVSSNAR